MEGWLIDMGDPAGSMALGIGLWVSLTVVWWGATADNRWSVVAWWGWTVAAALAGGVAITALRGELGLSSRGGALGVLVLWGGAWTMSVWRGGDRLNACWRTFDALTPGLLLGLASARVGCLLDGCDVGRPTDMPWAVAHADGTRAFDAHVVHYEVSPLAQTTASVHPLGLYLALWGGICAGLGLWYRWRSRRAGLATVVALVTFGVGGFAIEWLREPSMAMVVGDVLAYPWLYLGGSALVMVGWKASRKRSACVK